jgi:YidC/Oxa1 family membrane protein insertase
MFTITDSIANTGPDAAALTPYARIVRYGTPADASQIYVLHEGLIGVLGGTLKETSYGSAKEDGEDGAGPETYASTGGWVGITDKYWLVAPAAPASEEITSHFFYEPKGDFYQADYAGNARVLAAGQSVTMEQRLFAGAKVVEQLER